jgi:inorganic pyrophosphatase
VKEFKVFIEISKGSSVKYEIDHTTGVLIVDRFIFTAMGYPFNYGYLPNTHAQDGDPLDVVVISTYPVQPGALLECRVIGLLEMEDEKGLDNKVIAVPSKKIDPFYASIQDISDLNDATKNLIKHFFESYKELEPGKWTKVTNFLDKEAAYKEINASL